MRIIIADDEELARYSLKSMIAESEVECSLVGEAVNGEELVALVRAHLPDVAFVDIRMPKLDGLAAIAQAAVDSPDTQWIILTSYAEFDYAQTAVKLGAVEYLLKPVSPQELNEALGRRSAAASRERLAEGAAFESRMAALLNRTIHAGSLDDGRAIATVGALVLSDSDGRADERERRHLELCDALREAIRDAIGRERMAGLIPMAGDHLVVVYAWERGRYAEGAAHLRRFMSRASQVAARFAEGGAATTIVFTEECASFPGLAERIWRIEELAGLRTVAGVGGILSARELEESSREPALVQLATSLERLATAAAARNDLLLLAGLDEAEGLLASPLLARRRNVLDAVMRYLGVILRAKPPLGGQLADWLSSLRKAAPFGTGGGARPSGGVLIDQVRSFLDLRFAEDVTVAELARRLNLTPNYLSNLFHQQLGTTFSRYLTSRRMKRARELLADGRSQIQEVAHAVGYRSTRHFSRTFKGHFGVYPSDFRDGPENRPAP